MSQDKNKKLCLELMRADSEQQVINILTVAGYWNDESAWRNYGDSPNPWGVIGNQQATPEGALVEKLTNAGDALLLLACRKEGIDPEGPLAPQSIAAAVGQFFREGKNTEKAGRLADWSGEDLTRLAQRITISATGNMPKDGNPSISIADDGEGQTPDMMPNTFLSLNKSNKDRVPFVQGRFNMGGTGVLRHGGERRLQLIVSRRAPDLVSGTGRDAEWGFTIVRREFAKSGESNSKFRYLAPVNAHSGTGGVLSFSSDAMPIFPKLGDPHPDAYGRESSHGSLIKLYEYRLTGTKSNVVSSGGGLRQRLEMLLAGTGLPFRIFECRTGFRGHSGSFANNIQGVLNRLNAERQKNVEEGFPITDTITVGGEDIRVDVYAFKKGGADSYKQSEGVIYLLNGQVHAITQKTYFSNKSVGLSYLRDDLLVVVDLSHLSAAAREDMLMTSRDRLSKGGLATKVEDEVTDLLKHNQTLARLQARRRQDDIANKLADDKPLENLLRDMLKRNPDLSRVLGLGSRLSNPFDTRAVDTTPKFEGKKVPTFFRFRGKPEGHLLNREAQLGKKVRVDFETDGVNEFFGEADTKLTVSGARDGQPLPPIDCSKNPDNGTVHVHLTLPEDSQVGQQVDLRFDLASPLLLRPFTAKAKLCIVEPSKTTSGSVGRKDPPSDKKGVDQQSTQGVAIPKPVERRRADWDDTPKMNQNSALCVARPNADAPPDYHVNMDNLFLLNELKLKPKDVTLLRKRYQLALVLMGMCLVNDSERPLQTPNITAGETGDDGGLEEMVERTTRAFAPILLPMIASLANLAEDDEVIDDENLTGE